MPNKTIYVREADREVWEKAEKLAGSSVSSLITEALRRYVEEEERKGQEGMKITDIGTIEVALGTEERSYSAQFVGEWLLEPEPDETRTGEPGYDAGAYYGVALTERGRIAVYIQHVNDGFAPRLEDYDSFEEAEAEGQPGDILAMAAAGSRPGYVRKLDI